MNDLRLFQFGFGGIISRKKGINEVIKLNIAGMFGMQRAASQNDIVNRRSTGVGVGVVGLVHDEEIVPTRHEQGRGEETCHGHVGKQRILGRIRLWLLLRLQRKHGLVLRFWFVPKRGNTVRKKQAASKQEMVVGMHTLACFMELDRGLLLSTPSN